MSCYVTPAAQGFRGVLCGFEIWHALPMATSTKHPRRLLDAYRFPGFRPQATIKGVFGDPKARVVSLVRRGKKQSAGVAGKRSRAGTTAKCAVCATCHAAIRGSGWPSRFAGSTAEHVAR